MSQFFNKLSKNLNSFSLYSNSIYLFSSSIINALSGFIFWLIIARLYSPGILGLSSTFVIIAINIGLISRFGFDEGIKRYILTTSIKKQLINTINTICVIASMIFALVTAIILGILESPFRHIHTNHFTTILFISITIFSVLMIISDSVFIGMRRADLVLLKAMIFCAIRIILPYLFYSYGSIGIFLSFAFSEMISAIIAIFFLIPMVIPSFRFSIKIRIASIVQILRFSLGNYIYLILGSITPIVSQFIIIIYLSDEYAGYFFVCWTLANFIYMIPNSASISLMVESSIFCENGDDGFRILYLRTIFFILVLLIPVTIFSFLFGENLLSLYGKQFALNGLIVLQLMILTAFPLAVNTLIIAYFRIKEYNLGIVIINLLILIGTLGIGIILLSNTGMISIAIGWLTIQSIIAISVIISFFYKRRG